MVRVYINNHLANIKRFKRGHMGHHSNDPECGIHNFRFTPIQTVSEKLTNREAETELKKLETLWIRKTCSMQPWGMNYIEIDTETRTNNT